MKVPLTIVCPDCGGTCHLLTLPDSDDPFEVGDVATYRCVDCLDRWDVELEEDDLSGELEDLGDEGLER